MLEFKRNQYHCEICFNSLNRKDVFIELSFICNQWKTGLIFQRALTIFRIWGKKAVPTNFPPVTSTNVGIIFPKCLASSFNPFARLMLKLKAIPSASPKLLNLNQEHP